MLIPGLADRLGRLRGARASLLAAGLGAASAAALPPIHAIPILLLTMPAMLALLSGQTRMRGAGWIGFWFGFGHHLVGLYWITEAILIEAARYWWFVPLAVPSLSALMAAFIALPCALAWCVPRGPRRVLVLAGTWALFDLARMFVLGGFPWNPWGSVWAIPGALGTVMMQPAALVGVNGLTLATVLLACVPVLGRRAWLGGTAALAAWGAFGVWRTSLPAPPTPGFAVVLVQGNVAQGQKWDQALALGTFNRYLRLTHDGIEAAHGARAVVIWPETASPFMLDRDTDARAAITDAAGGAPVLAGSVRFDAERRPHNSLVAVVNAGPPAAIYDKSHLVPFGEYQPSWMPLPIQIVPGGGFVAGAGPQTFRVPGLPPFGAFICYEAIYSGAIVDEADRPAWLVNVTNDAWFGNSTGPRQHLAAVRMRAVEEGLPLVRAANTGITAAFDAFGHELGRIGMNRSAVITIDLPGALPQPSFGRFGLAIPGILAALISLAGIRLRRST